MRPTIEPEQSNIETYAEIKIGEYYFAWYMMGCLVVSLMLVFIWHQLQKFWNWVQTKKSGE